MQWLQDRLGMSETAAWKFIGRYASCSFKNTLSVLLWCLDPKLAAGCVVVFSYAFLRALLFLLSSGVS